MVTDGYCSPIAISYNVIVAVMENTANCNKYCKNNVTCFQQLQAVNYVKQLQFTDSTYFQLQRPNSNLNAILK